jgi:iron complex outermembrane receptor protein
MWNWAINDKFTTTTAVRVDRLALTRSGTFAPGAPQANNANWDRTVSKASVNFTGAWRPTAADTFRVSYARGVQAPSLVEFGGLQFAYQPFPGFTVDLIGNPYLRPSIVTNYEVAYDHEFTSAKLGVRLFSQQWKDLKSSIGTAGLDFAPTLTTNAAITYVNASDSKMNGVEFTASGKLPGGFHWRADDTYTDVKDSPYPGMVAATRYVAFQSTTPKTRGNLGLGWEKGPWEADANIHFVGEFKWYDLTNGALQPVKAYASLSSRVGYRTKDGLVLALSGQNLGSERQAQTRGLKAERRVQFTISKAW